VGTGGRGSGVWGRSGKGVINRGGGGAWVSTASRDSRWWRGAEGMGVGRDGTVVAGVECTVVEWCGSRHALQKLPS
jgi:hypothetical protein